MIGNGSSMAVNLTALITQNSRRLRLLCYARKCVLLLSVSIYKLGAGDHEQRLLRQSITVHCNDIIDASLMKFKRVHYIFPMTNKPFGSFIFNHVCIVWESHTFIIKVTARVYSYFVYNY